MPRDDWRGFRGTYLDVWAIFIGWIDRSAKQEMYRSGCREIISEASHWAGVSPLGRGFTGALLCDWPMKSSCSGSGGPGGRLAVEAGGAKA